MNYQSEQTEYFEKLIEPEILTKLPRYDTFCELLEMCKNDYADLPAISDMVNTITYGELYDRIACRRNFLYRNGFKKGDIIAVLAPNSMYSMELYMAIPTAGCIVIMLPSAENAISRECLTALINKFDIKGLFINPEYKEVAEGQPVKVFDIHDTDNVPGPTADVTKDDIAVICFSVNNSPDNPYGAMLSHGAIMRAAHNGLFIPGHTYNQRTIAILPLSHVFGAIRGLLTCIYTGALVGVDDLHLISRHQPVAAYCGFQINGLPGGDVVQSRHRYPGAVQPQLAFHHPPVGVQRRVAGVFPGRDDVPVAPYLLLVAKGIVV